MTWRIIGPIAGACAIAGVMIALLAPNHGNTVLDPVAKAADTTAAAGTAEFGMAGSIGAAGQTIPINGSGAVDMRSQRMRMSMSFPIPGVGNSDVEEIFDGNAIYMRFPSALTQRMPGGKPWMKLDLATVGKAAGVDLKSMMRANQSNPSDFLQALKGVGTSKVLGQEDIGGAATTHYQATIDLTKAADRIPDKKTADSVKQMIASSGANSMPVDVWIDRSGRVRREHVAVNAGGGSMDMTISYTRFGAPVDTTPPPADQVMDAGALLGAMSGGSNG
jgi:hypothetical protein